MKRASLLSAKVNLPDERKQGLLNVLKLLR
jgi:hypothetical protein